MKVQIICLLSIPFGVWSDNTTETSVTAQFDSDGNMCEVCICEAGKVDCSNLKLEDHFDDNHWPKTPMIEVTFAQNHIVHLRAFPAVEVNRLILRQNKITSIDDAAFLKIKNLTELDLSHNELTTPLLGPHIFQGPFSPEAYEPLKKLIRLDLSNNALHSLHQDLFEHVGNLKELSLDGNSFGVIDTPTVIALGNLPYIEKINMSYCDLTDLPEHIFHPPKYLKTLDLRGNRFRYPPRALEEARALEYLVLDENPFVTIDKDNAFPLMPSLKEVSLCCMYNLTDIGAGALSGLIDLEILHIEGCPRFEILNESAIVRQGQNGAEWPPLRILQLADNSLKYLPAGLVGSWDKLTVLDLHNNAWSCDCNNQYLVESLLPGLGKTLMGESVNSLTCSAPPEHRGKTLTSLSSWHLRCLDLYNARPEKDASLLVGALIGVLLAVPVILLIFVFWRRGFFFCGTQGPASFSRAFYKRADNDDDF